MTRPALGPPREPADAQAALAAVRAAGGRVSTPMRLLVEALFAASEPLTAEALAEGLGGSRPRLEPSSVYRNLERLERLGIVRHVHLAHGPGLYALARSPEPEYLVCDACGAVRAVPSAELDGVRELTARRLGHHARFGHFPMHGLCARCAARPTSH